MSCAPRKAPCSPVLVHQRDHAPSQSSPAVEPIPANVRPEQVNEASSEASSEWSYARLGNTPRFHSRPEYRSFRRQESVDSMRAVLLSLAMLFVLLPMLLFMVGYLAITHDPPERVGIGTRLHHGVSANGVSDTGRIGLAGGFSCGDPESCRESIITITAPEKSQVKGVTLGPSPAKIGEPLASGVGVRSWPITLSSVDGRLTEYLSADITCTTGKSVSISIEIVSPAGKAQERLTDICP